MTPILLKELNPVNFGIYIVLMSVVSYLSLCNLGLPQTLIRELSTAINHQDNNRKNKLISSTFFYYIRIILLMALASIISIFVLPSSYASFINYPFILFLIVATKLIVELFDAILKADEDYATGKVILTIGNIITGLGTLVVIELGFGLFELMILPIVTNILSIIVMFFLSKKKVDYCIKKEHTQWVVFKSMLPSSAWYLLGGIGSMLIFQIDSLVITIILGASYVANYAILFRLADMIRQVLANIVNVMFTKIASGSQSNHHVVNIHNKLLLITLVLSLIICLILHLRGYSYIVEWMGLTIEPSNNIFICFSLFIILFSCNHVTGVFLGAIGKHKLPVIVGYIQSLINISLSTFLLYTFKDIYWVILSTIISLVITNLWFNIVYFYRIQNENCNSRTSISV